MIKNLLSFFIALASIFLSGGASAFVSEQECAQVRTLSSTEDPELFFQWKNRFFPFNQDNVAKQLPSAKGGADLRIIYLARGADTRPTLFLIKQSFNTDGKPWDFVRTYNNVRRTTLEPKFDIYQKYHQAHVEDEDLTEWFHVGPGLITRRGLMESRESPRPREFFAFDSRNDEMRAYLFMVKGIRDTGTCVDFSTYISASVKSMTFEIRNLRRTEGRDYRDPLVGSGVLKP
jgi:hypothetical protein